MSESNLSDRIFRKDFDEGVTLPYDVLEVKDVREAVHKLIEFCEESIMSRFGGYDGDTYVEKIKEIFGPQLAGDKT